jgi:hypothetical protein
METLKDTRDKRLSTKDFATVEERREVDEAAPAVGETHPQPSSLETAPLMKTDDEEDFRARWKAIQTSFVDEPRRSVEQADELVAELMQHLARNFSDQRSNLETQWQRSEQVSTEELRGALRRYRSFFDRLLSI